MKKIYKILIIIFIIIIALDFAAYTIVYYNTIKSRGDSKDIKLPSYFTNRLRMFDETSLRYMELNIPYIFRPPSHTEYKKPPIWLFGCSFAYGASMVNGDYPDEETFGNILSEYTKRPVYNRAYSGWGIQQMLWQLEQGDIFKELPKPEYIIFTFIADHARRTQKIVYDAWSDGEYLRYKIDKNGDLKQVKGVLVPLWKFYFVKLWLTYLEYNIRLADNERDKNFDLMKAMFIKSKSLVEQKYPDTKFIILKYNGNDGFERWFIETERWKELSEQGFIVIDAGEMTGKDLHDKQFTDDDNYHPNTQAWIEISKKLSEKYIK